MYWNVSQPHFNHSVSQLSFLVLMVVFFFCFSSRVVKTKINFLNFDRKRKTGFLPSDTQKGNPNSFEYILSYVRGLRWTWRQYGFYLFGIYAYFEYQLRNEKYNIEMNFHETMSLAWLLLLFLFEKWKLCEAFSTRQGFSLLTRKSCLHTEPCKSRYI